MQDTIIFIHGMFMNPKSWEKWVSYFEVHGYRCIAPAWPYHEGEPAALRANTPPQLGDLTLADVVTEMERVVDSCEEPPFLVGHSLGGLIVQLLVNKGKAAAGVCISTVAPNAMLSLEWNFIKSTFPILNPFKGNLPQEMDQSRFSETFANTMNADDSSDAYNKYATHESREVLRNALGETGHLDMEEPHPPLLFVSGEEDAIVPSSLVEKNCDAYSDITSVKTFVSFPQRGHLICNDPGWAEVAEYVRAWLINHEMFAY